MAIINVGLFMTRGSVTMAGGETSVTIALTGPSSTDFIVPPIPNWPTTVWEDETARTAMQVKFLFSDPAPVGGKLRWLCGYF